MILAGCARVGFDSGSDSNSPGGDAASQPGPTYTIGGTITGEFDGELLLVINDLETHTVRSDGSFAFVTELPAGDDYDVHIYYVPEGWLCTIEDGTGTGTVGDEDVTEIEVVCVPLDDGAFLYSGASEWLTYIKNDGSTPYEASGAPCDPDADTGPRGYFECLNAAQLRAIPLPGITTCSGLSAWDVHGVFDWRCDESTNPIRFVSFTLNDGKGLADLISGQPTVAWMPIGLLVSNGTGVIGRTLPSSWWTNPLVQLTDGGAIGVPGTIFVVPEDTEMVNAVSDRYCVRVTASRTALVVLPGATLSGPAISGENLVHSIEEDFLWFEGAFDLTGWGRFFNDWADFLVCRNMEILGNPNPVPADRNLGFDLCGARQGFFDNIRSSRNYRQGFTINGSENNHFRNLVAVNNAQYGVYLGAACGDTRNNTFENIVATNNDVGIYVRPDCPNCEHNRFVNVTVANNGLGAVLRSGDSLINWTVTNNERGGLLNSGRGTTIHNVVAINDGPGFGDAGYGALMLDDADYSTIADVVQGRGTVGLQMHGVSHTYFSGLLELGDNGSADCDLSSFAGLDASCQPTPPSDAEVRLGTVNYAQSFIGKTSADSVNGSGSSGACSYDDVAVADWTHFEIPHRGWGADGGAFPAVDHAMPCVTPELCRIWDWSLRSTDDELLGQHLQPTGDEYLVHIWLGPDEAACADHPGAIWGPACDRPGFFSQVECEAAGTAWSSPKCHSRFLRRAVEITGDVIGNDNGLCETNEHCIWSPNIGSYQGHGELIAAEPFANGVLTGITLYRYASNGR